MCAPSLLFKQPHKPEQWRHRSNSPPFSLRQVSWTLTPLGLPRFSPFSPKSDVVSSGTAVTSRRDPSFLPGKWRHRVPPLFCPNRNVIEDWEILTFCVAISVATYIIDSQVFIIISHAISRIFQLLVYVSKSYLNCKEIQRASTGTNLQELWRYETWILLFHTYNVFFYAIFNVFCLLSGQIDMTRVKEPCFTISMVGEKWIVNILGNGLHWYKNSLIQNVILTTVYLILILSINTYLQEIFWNNWVHTHRYV